MIINYKTNNIRLLEQKLDGVIKEIFIKFRLGRADWDIDDILRCALVNSPELEKAKTLINNYNGIFDKALKAKLTLNNKYTVLYKLEK